MFWSYLILGLGMMMIIEGCLLALFPNRIIGLLKQISKMNVFHLRIMAILLSFIGLLTVSFIIP